MGVHGLTTFLRDNKTQLAQTIELKPSKDANKPLVVDGWSFIYAIWNGTTRSWVYGGDYEVFATTVVEVVRGWISVGLKPIFVFDGPSPPLKFSTLISRKMQNYIQPSVLFFRTSDVSRSTPRFLSENRVPPPLLYDTCVCALQSEDSFKKGEIDLHFADEEGDPYAVELAGRLKAYVAGQDSDYLVLNADGYRGYLPLDEMVWTSSAMMEENDGKEDDGEFMTVRKPKSRAKKANAVLQAGRGIIPPTLSPDLTLTVSAYSPTKLASHLDLPVSLLPLLAAFLGNDYIDHTVLTTKSSYSKFFDRGMNLSQRITHVASTLRTLLSPKRKKAAPQDVVELIDLAVTALIAARPGSQVLASGEQAKTVESIVESTLQYALPKFDLESKGLWPTAACALHAPDICPLVLMFDHSTPAVLEGEEEVFTPEDLERQKVRKLYIAEFRAGHFSPLLMNVLNSSSHWPRLFLESPDIECVVASISLPLMEWIFAIMDDAVGLPLPTPPPSEAVVEEREEEEDEDPDELIDVVEDSDEEEDDEDDFSDPESASVDALRGALQRLRVPDESETSVASSSKARSKSRSLSRSRRLEPPKVVEVYLRRGTRLGTDIIHVSSIPSLLATHDIKFTLELELPVVLHSEDVRFQLFLSILNSDVKSVRALPSSQLLPVLAVRWIASRLHERSIDASKEREKERWMKSEVSAFLASAVPDSTLAPNTIAPSTLMSTAAPEVSPPALVERSIQLTAQVLTALETISQLAETLLLSYRVPLIPTSFSGRQFHELLARAAQAPSAFDALPSVPSAIWVAATTGLADAFTEERRAKTKKKKGSETVKTSSPMKGAVPRNIFDMLQAAD